MSNYIFTPDEGAVDTSTGDSDGGYSQVLGGGSAPAAGGTGVTSGPIGQQIGQKISGGPAQQGNAKQPSASNGGVSPNWPYGTSTGNGNITTSTGNAGTASGTTYSISYSNTVPAAAPTPVKTGWNQINSLSKAQPVTKTKVRYVIIKSDKTTLELRELSTITPQEMIGISKFLGLVTTYTVLVLGQALVSYNFNIKWSEVINSLDIAKHFADGKDPSDYDNDNEVLDILLYDPT